MVIRKRQRPRDVSDPEPLTPPAFWLKLGISTCRQHQHQQRQEKQRLVDRLDARVFFRFGVAGCEMRYRTFFLSLIFIAFFFLLSFPLVCRRYFAFFGAFAGYRTFFPYLFPLLFLSLHFSCWRYWISSVVQCRFTFLRLTIPASNFTQYWNPSRFRVRRLHW